MQAQALGGGELEPVEGEGVEIIATRDEAMQALDSLIKYAGELDDTVSGYIGEVEEVSDGARGLEGDVSKLRGLLERARGILSKI